MGPKTRSVSMSKAQYMREYRAKLSPSVKKERHRKQVENARLRRQALGGGGAKRDSLDLKKPEMLKIAGDIELIETKSRSNKPYLHQQRRQNILLSL